MNSLLKSKIDIIKAECANYYGRTIEEIESVSRKRELLQPRQVAHYFAHKKLNPLISLKEIGDEIGGKDYATIYNSCKTINNIIETDKKERDKINELEVKIENGFMNLEAKIYEANKKFPTKAVVYISDVEDGEIIVRNFIYDGSKTEFTILKNGICEFKCQGADALVKFKQITNNITL